MNTKNAPPRGAGPLPRQRGARALSCLAALALVALAPRAHAAPPNAATAAPPAADPTTAAAPAGPPPSAAPPPAATPPPAAAPPAAKPLDAREPPFAAGDYAWLNGSNSQPESLLKVGPVVLSIYVDAFYAWQFRRPVDHTIFPTTTAPRHNEFGFNLASLGLELPPHAIDSPGGGPVGQLSLQYGAITETIGGQDRTVDRGFFLSRTALQPIRTASAGWHFHALHGVNLEFGIFPSYVGMESYLPQENWNYTHPFLSDFTPYYFYGGRVQIYPSTSVKVEVWLVNGWQTFGQWQESRAGGYLVQWRPTDRLVLTNVVYAGREQPTDAKALRLYTDNYAQLQYYRAAGGVVTSSALGLVADLGYERRGAETASGVMGGFSLTHRTELWRRVGLTLRGDYYYDKTRALTTLLPVGNPYTLPRGDDPFRGGGLTATLDYRPSPWLLWRLEYAHREANVPFFSGRRGITGDGPRGTPSEPAEAGAFAPDLRTNDDRLLGNVTLRL